MLTLQNTDAIRRIEASIGYTFRDKRLLVQVFTRKTYMRVDPEAPDNEVLEFYGDMLMSYHVTTYFIEKFAHMLNDGLYFMRTVEQFTEMRSHYVRNQYLTERIKQLIPNIDRMVRAQNPRVELPKDNQKAYADLFESLIGAVYLDSYRDDDLIRAFILRHLNIEPKATEEVVRRSSRTVVLPSVSLVDREPEESYENILPDEAEMPESVLVEEPTVTALDIAPDTAEEPADTTAVMSEAAAAVEHATEADTAEDSAAAVHIPTPCQDELAAFCREVGYETPVFGETPKNAPHARPVAACTVRFRNKRGKPVKISLNDSGKTLAEATEKAAVKMLRKLREQQAAEEAQAAKLSEKAPSEAPAEVPVEAIVEAPAEAPIAVAAEAVVEAVVETPAEVPAEVPAEAVVEAPAEAVVEAPVEAVAETSAEAVVEAPAEAIVEAPAEATAAPKPASRRRKAPAKEPKADLPASETAVETPAAPETKKPARKASAKKPASKSKATEPTSDGGAEVVPAPPPATAKKPAKRAPAKKAAKAAGEEKAE